MSEALKHKTTELERLLVRVALEHSPAAPLADWSEDEVWTAIRADDIPYNTLHDQGYRSIGCAPCTRPTVAGEDVRAGRWWWEQPRSRECGLHLTADGRLVRAPELTL